MRILIFRGNYRDSTLEPKGLASFDEYIDQEEVKEKKMQKITKFEKI